MSGKIDFVKIQKKRDLEATQGTLPKNFRKKSEATTLLLIILELL